MPRLNSNLQRAVFFLYGKNPKTGNIQGPIGTGVLVGLPRKHEDYQVPDLRHVYAITCKHVAPGGASIIRLNTKDGKSRLIELEPHEWEFVPGGDDIAAADISDRLKPLDDVSCVPSNLFASKDYLRAVEFGIGEDGFMLGLFADHSGDHRNLVAARFGNVSLLADEDAPIEQYDKAKRPSHIFDMRSRTGFSGSPVFVYRTPAGDLRDIASGPKVKIRSPGGPSPQSSVFDDFLFDMEARGNTFLLLFGIHVGQYPEKIVAARKESNQFIKDGDQLRVPSSMTIVAPAYEISTLLDLPAFVEQRREREMADEKTAGNRPESESANRETNPSANEKGDAIPGVMSKTRPESRSHLKNNSVTG